MGKVESQHSNMKILILLCVLSLLLSQVAASPLPAPQRRRFGGRGRGRYGRPPPPRYYGSNTQSSSSNYFNTVLPLKGAAVAGGGGRPYLPLPRPPNLLLCGAGSGEAATWLRRRLKTHRRMRIFMSDCELSTFPM